jgi:hypothetical protein
MVVRVMLVVAGVGLWIGGMLLFADGAHVGGGALILLGALLGVPGVAKRPFVALRATLTAFMDTIP